jgi:hypothetical protein
MAAARRAGIGLGRPGRGVIQLVNAGYLSIAPNGHGGTARLTRNGFSALVLRLAQMLNRYRGTSPCSPEFRVHFRVQFTFCTSSISGGNWRKMSVPSASISHQPCASSGRAANA